MRRRAVGTKIESTIDEGIISKCDVDSEREPFYYFFWRERASPIFRVLATGGVHLDHIAVYPHTSAVIGKHVDLDLELIFVRKKNENMFLFGCRRRTSIWPSQY